MAGQARSLYIRPHQKTHIDATAFVTDLRRLSRPCMLATPSGAKTVPRVSRDTFPIAERSSDPRTHSPVWLA